MSMAPAKADKGIPRKPMRKQLRKRKIIKKNKRVRNVR